MVLIHFLNSGGVSRDVGLDDGNIVNQQCQTCLRSARRQSPKAHVHHSSLKVQGRIPSRLLGRSADAAGLHECTLPGCHCSFPLREITEGLVTLHMVIAALFFNVFNFHVLTC